ncbi:hypothetical protein ACLOJK_001348 [Asimina triloba]
MPTPSRDFVCGPGFETSNSKELNPEHEKGKKRGVRDGPSIRSTRANTPMLKSQSPPPYKTPPSSSKLAYTSKKRLRVDSDESPETKHFRPDLLDILDDADAAGSTEDLATVMKSLEEEISQIMPAPPPVQASESDSGESQPDLGYLLEASDDELGLPPTSSSAGNDWQDGFDAAGAEPEPVGFGQMWGFEDVIPSYDALEFGTRLDGEKADDGAVVFDGLFNYEDVAGSGPSEFSEFSWRPESLPAL